METRRAQRADAPWRVVDTQFLDDHIYNTFTNDLKICPKVQRVMSAEVVKPSSRDEVKGCGGSGRGTAPWMRRQYSATRHNTTAGTAAAVAAKAMMTKVKQCVVGNGVNRN